MNNAATETSEEIKNSAEWTAFRAMTVSSPARIAAIENIQKKTDSQPDKTMCFVLGTLDFDLVVGRTQAMSSEQRTKYKDQSTETSPFVFHSLSALLEHLSVPDKSRARISR